MDEFLNNMRKLRKVLARASDWQIMEEGGDGPRDMDLYVSRYRMRQLSGFDGTLIKLYTSGGEAVRTDKGPQRSDLGRQAEVGQQQGTETTKYVHYTCGRSQLGTCGRIDLNEDLAKKSTKRELPLNIHRDGNCFEVAGNLIVDHFLVREREPEPVLIHAEIGGTGALEGWRIWHAWVEKDGIALDHSNGRVIELPIALFRVLARVGREYRYSVAEARKLMGETRHFGPWEQSAMAEPYWVSDSRSEEGYCSIKGRKARKRATTEKAESPQETEA